MSLYEIVKTKNPSYIINNVESITIEEESSLLSPIGENFVVINSNNKYYILYCKVQCGEGLDVGANPKSITATNLETIAIKLADVFEKQGYHVTYVSTYFNQDIAITKDAIREWLENFD